jgi:GT2 family glycosyltransferase
MKPIISIITVTHNVENFMIDYFDSILKNDYKNIEILIYDWESSDNTLKIINQYRNKHKFITLFQGKNIGFAGANNFLSKKTQGDYLFILNSDTKIDENCLINLINNPKKNDSIIIPSQFSFDKKYMHTGLGIDLFSYPNDHKLFYADGAAIFIKRKLFKKLGMFDEDYFIFFEDIDLSWRAHLFGIKLVQEKNAIVYHYSGGTIIGGNKKNKLHITNSFRRYLNEKNALMNIIKNYSMTMVIVVIPIYLVFSFIEMLFFLLSGNWVYVKCYIDVYSYIIKNINNILLKRKSIQKKRIISDIEILKKIYIGNAKFDYILKNGMPKFIK